MSGLFDLERWKADIWRWLREQTKLSNICFAEWPEIKQFMRAEGLGCDHPLKRDKQGGVMVDESRYVIVRY